MKKSFLLATAILLFQACETNPYPQQGGEIVNGPKPIQRNTAPAFSIDVKATLNFREGVKTKHKVKYLVPEGTPVLTFSELPDGMKWDEKESSLIWEPGFTAANDSADPSIKVRRYPVSIWLRKESDTRTFIKKDIVLEVADTPRDFKVEGTVGTKTVDEGNTLNYQFDFKNVDFPAGPFTIKTENLPFDLKTSLNGTTAKLEFSPDYYFVKARSSCGYYRCTDEFNGNIIITAPDSRELKVPLKLKVNDTRLDPKFTTPSEITQGLDVSFVVSAFDPNAEVAPQITLENKPRDGSIKFGAMDNSKNDLKQTNMKLTWRDIPVSRRGTSNTFKFEACVYDHRTRFRTCENHSVTVNIEEQTHQAPIIDREKWPLGRVEYIKSNQKLSLSLPVQDGDDQSRSVKNVVIEPEAMRSIVEFKNNKIIIQSDKEGLQQFQLRAQSKFGIESVESFQFEILPATWSEIFALINNPRNLENVKNKALFNESLDWINPDLQNLDRRILSHRKTLVVGTDVLQHEDLVKRVEEIKDKFKNIIILSPLIESFKDSLKEELNKLGVLVLGRFSKVTQDQLDAYHFLLGSEFDLTHPKWKVRLKGELTSESSDPILMKKRIDSVCKEALSIGNESTGIDYLTSVKCNRENGGYLLVNSIEFGDMATNEDDNDIPRKWLETLRD